MSKNFYLFLYFIIFLVAAFFRIYDIDYRVFHHDEGVNHYFLNRISDLGYYPYSHENYHGPLYFYLLYFITRIGDSEIFMRSVAILSGLAIIPLLFGFRKIIGLNVSLIAAALFAVSANQIFMNRYNIHESTLLFAEVLFLLSIYAWCKKFSIKYIYLSFLSLALMITVKETFIIFIAGTSLAGLFLLHPKTLVEKIKSQNYHFMMAFLASVIFIFFVFTGGFTWIQGVREMVLAVPQWIGRGDAHSGDVGHFKSWSYYLCILLGEGVFTKPFDKVCNGCLNYTPSIGSDLYYILIVPLLSFYLFVRSFKFGMYYLSLVAISLLLIAIPGIESLTISQKFTFLSDPRYGFNLLVLGSLIIPGLLIYNSEKKLILNFTGYLAIISVFIFTVYSWVSYKTPWLMINLTIGIILLFACFISELISAKKYSIIGMLILAVCLLSSIILAVRFNFDTEDPKENPYYYVHTRKGMLSFVEDLKHYQRSKESRILIDVASYWPLPYYIRNLKLKYAYGNKEIIENVNSQYDVMILNSDSKFNSDAFISKYYRFSDNQEVLVYFRK